MPDGNVKEDEDLGIDAGLPIDEVYKRFNANPHGLTDSQVAERLNKYGPNVLDEKKKSLIILEFLNYFKSPLIIILLIAVAASLFFGEKVNAIIIAMMIVLSISLNFFQEHNAEKAAEKLKETVKTKVMVLRDGKSEELRIDDLVPGDIIELSAGDIVPADARVIFAKDFFVNQSSLTGESFPVEKAAEMISARSEGNSWDNILFMGTNVVSGSSTAIVLRTGRSTEFGKISRKLSSKSPDTEFEKGIMSFSQLILKATIFLVLFIFLFNAIMKKDVMQSFLFAIAVAVGLTPELLPMIMSVNMAKGSLLMAKKGVIVKRLSAIPNFGSMDVLCTDKTGTLTEDKIHLVKYVDYMGRDSSEVLLYAYLNSYHQTGIKNPLDQAVLEFKKQDISSYKKIDEIPFDFVRKKMSVIVEDTKRDKRADRSSKSRRYIIVKGAAEEIFKSCKSYCNQSRCYAMDPAARSRIQKRYDSLSAEGFRVLAVAIKPLSDKKRSYDKDDESGLELLGFIAFLDPPKSDVKQVLEEINSMGIEVKVITGDNELVTQKICNDIGLVVKGVVLGTQISTMADDALRVVVENTTIFARVSPDQKTRIILALQANNHAVGYIGDGINDAPSLKAADVGISVNSAVDVAKESASIVLTHKSLNVLKEGIIEGRKTFGNTMKYIMMNISSNFGNMFSVAGAVLFLPFLPMLPIQILLNNFLYDFSQITIPTDNVDASMIKKPKRWDMSFVKRFMIFFGPISSLFDFLTFFIMFYLFKAPPAIFQTAWFMESLATQTLVIYVIRTKETPFFESSPSKYLLFSTLGMVLIGWILPYTIVGRYFGLEPLSIKIVLVLFGLVLSYLMLVEILKRYFYRKNDF